MIIKIDRKTLIKNKGQLDLPLAEDKLDLDSESQHNLNIILGNIISDKYINLKAAEDENTDR